MVVEADAGPAMNRFWDVVRSTGVTEILGIASIPALLLKAEPSPADRAHRPDKLYLAIDGTGVPMVPAATTGRAGKSVDGRARTREVKLACLFTQTALDEQGRVGDAGGRLGRDAVGRWVARIG